MGRRQRSGRFELPALASVHSSFSRVYVKTVGPTSAPFTHYWRIVADLGGGGTEVFWGHAKSLREAASKRSATEEAARQR